MVDPEKIRELVEMMSAHDLSEISLRNGEEEIRLKRAGAGGNATFMYPPMMMPPMAPAGGASVAPPASGSGAASPAGALVEIDEHAGLVAIESPMVGTFYEAPDPQSPAFVSVGAKVSANTVVCIVEAMKVFNEIKAGVSGTIAKVLVKNEAPVEYGQPLFMVKPD